ncbi:hypothetical protein [Novipirellula herctigrandis]
MQYVLEFTNADLDSAVDRTGEDGSDGSRDVWWKEAGSNVGSGS